MCLLFPLAGPLLYLLFGVNRIHSRAAQLSEASGHRLPREPVGTGSQDSLVDAQTHHDATVPLDASLARVSETLSPFRASPGNDVQPMYNGEAAYPAMLEAIAAAQSRVWLTSYIFNRDALGARFIDALAAAAARGVDVRVLVDGVGEFYGLPRRVTPELRRRGVAVVRFLPPRLLPPSLFINLRTHRKLLVVDTEVAFLGGMNISKLHLTDEAAPPARKRDVHFRVEGPVTRQLAAVFSDDWNFASGERLPTAGTTDSETALAAPSGRAGAAVCRTFIDGPDHSLDSLHLLMIGAIACARTRIQIMTPYFLPSRKMVGALQAAALRGVDVQILLPARSNLPFVDWATRKMLVELVERDVRVALQPAPFAHSKLFVLDGAWSLVGSSNLDPRSLRLNFEVMMEVRDDHLGRELSDHIEAAWREATPVTLDSLAADSLARRTRDGIAWLFSPYL